MECRRHRLRLRLQRAMQKKHPSWVEIYDAMMMTRWRWKMLFLICPPPPPLFLPRVYHPPWKLPRLSSSSFLPPSLSVKNKKEGRAKKKSGAKKLDASLPRLSPFLFRSFSPSLFSALPFAITPSKPCEHKIGQMFK